jgi:hypothetical protein
MVRVGRSNRERAQTMRRLTSFGPVVRVFFRSCFLIYTNLFLYRFYLCFEKTRRVRVCNGDGYTFSVVWVLGTSFFFLRVY